MKAVVAGVKVVLQDPFSSLSYLPWNLIETRACGAKVFDVEKLRSLTNYKYMDEDHPVVKRFWKAFESFNETEKAQYLKFVWGRTRLPIDTSNLEYNHEIELMDNLDPKGFPQSHTCFFRLDIPDYKTDEICRQRLLQAAQLCGGIDNDHEVMGSDDED